MPEKIKQEREENSKLIWNNYNDIKKKKQKCCHLEKKIILYFGATLTINRLT